LPQISRSLTKPFSRGGSLDLPLRIRRIEVGTDNHENALEIVVAFSTAEDETAAVKSDLRCTPRSIPSPASRPHAEYAQPISLSKS
jgi:hypothetical protein